MTTFKHVISPLAAWLSALALTAAAPASAMVFSLDGRSAPNGIGPADILQSFGGGQFTVVATAGDLGLVRGDDITGLHHGAIAALTLWFSVDRSSSGLADTAVRQQGNGQAADVYSSGDLAPAPAGTNRLAIPNADLGLADDANIDAAFWFTWQPERDFFFTLAPGSPSLAALHAHAADILIHRADGSLGVWKTASELGLLDTDVIDAFQFADAPQPGQWEMVFSLAPGSPTLAALGASPADILAASTQGLLVRTPAWELGLAVTDNLDVIGGTFDCFTDPRADCKIPEPGSLPLAVLAVGSLLAFPRRRAAVA